MWTATRSTKPNGRAIQPRLRNNRGSVCPRWTAALTFAAALAAYSATVSHAATNFSWAAAAAGNWTDAAKWMPNTAYPGQNANDDDATIAPGGAGQIVTLDTSPTIDDFTFDWTGATFKADGRTLTLSSNDVHVTLKAGTIEWKGSTMAGGIDVTGGTFLVLGASSITGVLLNAGTITVRGEPGVPAKLTFATSFTNTGMIVLTSLGVGGGAAEWDHQVGQVFNEGEVRIEVGTGGGRTFRTGSGGMTNSGTVKVNQNATLGGTGLNWSNLGTFEVAVAKTATIEGNEFVNLLPTGVIKGKGKLDVSGTTTGKVRNEKLVRPGDSAGALEIGGDYEEDATAIVEIEIGGTTPGSGHDQLVVTGMASLAGTLQVTLIDGFSPSDGDTFDVLTAASVSGQFSTLNLPPGFEVDYLSTAVRISFSAAALPTLSLGGTLFALFALLTTGMAVALRRRPPLAGLLDRLP